MSFTTPRIFRVSRAIRINSTRRTYATEGGPPPPQRNNNSTWYCFLLHKRTPVSANRTGWSSPQPSVSQLPTTCCKATALAARRHPRSTSPRRERSLGELGPCRLSRRAWTMPTAVTPTSMSPERVSRARARQNQRS